MDTIEWFKSRAKSLHRAVTSEAHAQRRVAAVLHDSERVTLQRAQHVVAVESGFVNWKGLLDAPDDDRQAIVAEAEDVGRLIDLVHWAPCWSICVRRDGSYVGFLSIIETKNSLQLLDGLERWRFSSDAVLDAPTLGRLAELMAGADFTAGRNTTPWAAPLDSKGLTVSDLRRVASRHDCVVGVRRTMSMKGFDVARTPQFCSVFAIQGERHMFGSSTLAGLDRALSHARQANLDSAEL